MLLFLHHPPLAVGIAAMDEMGLRDADDHASQSCRRLWRDAPRLGERRDMVLHTGHGAALFDAPRTQWLQPLSDWSRNGRVAVGEVKVASAK